MKRIIKVLIIIIIGIITIPVHAENYKVKELIPLNTKTTIKTDNFTYIELYTDQKNVYFNGVLNRTDKERLISVSIGLFDKNKKNIGTINDCKTYLLKVKPKDQMSHKVEINSTFMAKGKTNKDVKYIAILGDNINCRQTGSLDYIGKTVEQIGKTNKSILTDDVVLTLKIIGGVIAILILLFLYKFLFTKQYVNIDGEDVRKAYKNKKEDKKEEKFVFVEEKKVEEEKKQPEEEKMN